MHRRLKSIVPALLSAVLLVSCSDRTDPTEFTRTHATASVISDAAHGGDGSFMWVAPTVPTTPAYTAAFDNSLLPQLSVEICALGAQGGCTGPLVDRLTSTSTPLASRLATEAENYAADWYVNPDRVPVNAFYRVSVLRGALVLGFIDVYVGNDQASLAGLDLTRYAGVVKRTILPIRFRVQLPTVRTQVRINEVVTNNGTPGDWVELHNAALAPLSLAGHTIRASDDARTYTFPAGTMIPAGGFLIVDQSVLGFDFVANDAVRFMNPEGRVVDSYAWATHAPTSYGRCPDHSGAFTATTNATKGAPNDCTITVKINEVESSGGVPGDWVELYNPALIPFDLSGYIFKDDNDAHIAVLPAGSVIAPGGYLVLNEIVNGVGQFGFGLGSPDAARLFAPDGTTLIDSYAWTPHAATTYGRCPNGTGVFKTTTTVTKGTANDCSVPIAQVKINEVESSGGSPGDWVEIYNPTNATVDLTGYIFKDDNDAHIAVLAAGSTIPPGGYLVLNEIVNGVGQFGFGLGAPDMARLFAPDGTTIVDQYAWTSHATTTYGRCPSGSGGFTTTTSVTKGAANDCGSTVRINEVESNGGTPGDWVELYNPSPNPVNISGYVFRDDDDTHFYAIPAGTTIAGNGFYVMDVAQFVFGLGAPDAARLFLPDGVTLVDAYAWTAHAPITYGRCPDGTGAFAATTASTKGTANACASSGGTLPLLPWIGDPDFVTVDAAGQFVSNLSGLKYEASGTSAPGVLWGVQNGPGTLYRLVWNGSIWVPDQTNNWGAGKPLRYTDGTGDPDSEGITFTTAGPGGGIYVSTERNNSNNGLSRLSVLRFDPNAAGATLTATNDWNLTPDLPVVGPNLGLEGVTWIPDGFLTTHGFFDEGKNKVYSPSDYPLHGSGIFFVGVEGNGQIYGYALNSDNTFSRVATISSTFTAVMDLTFDAELGNFFAICDDGCGGHTALLAVNGIGRFTVTNVYDRPALMPNINNEGFTISPLAECVNNRRPVFWSDDSATGGHSIRRGMMACIVP